ncbi:Na+/H+ antiporter subunit E [Nonomuraea gerenzanensis]|uniref:Na(+) H(+) antiporter subunit E n=1 Tax=Nonomuraea gerenzanensis TaxID=93944 RepID=A0A1M4E9D5_9ACTN|nr:Na+/H+ antiporter subunit E [Nonomuraea gerenzanensis]UBU17468.1 Na+/H+ antiporter subunit E [Nonomuraea gerenzanensis]SBO95223.1 Na(+) H(+) antiporter subunit E [Nonomuraea gerenzanensis]
MNRELLAPWVLGRRVPLPLVAWLALVWVTLWGDLTVGNVLGGLLTGLVVTWLLPLPILDPGIRVHPVALARLLLWIAWNMVLSTARVVLWVALPGPPPTRIVRVRLRTSSESMTVLLMIALSTVPGSLVVEAYRQELVVHVLGLTGDVTGTVRADVAELESRIVRAFGTRRDREELG